MWLYVPSQYAPVSEHSISDGTEPFQPLAQSVTWRGKHMPPAFWRRAWPTISWTMRLSGAISQPLTLDRGAAKWIASLEVYRANRSAPPASDSARTMNVGSGATYSASFARLISQSSDWRTYPDLFGTDYPLSPETWPSSGIARHGALYPLAPSALLTAARAFLSSPLERIWPTATATGNHNRAGLSAASGDGLGTAAQMWPTPVASDDNKSPEAHLAMKARLPGGARSTITSLNVLIKTDQWQTPSTDSFRSRGGDRKNEMGLDQEARLWQTPRASPGENRTTKPTPSQIAGTHGMSLAAEVSTWPTPTASIGAHSGREKTKEGQSDCLVMTANNWPTPTTQDAKNNAGPSQYDRNTPPLNVAVMSHDWQIQDSPPALEIPTHGEQSSPSVPTSRRVLNPDFVDWLMGMVPGWTDSAPLVME